MGVLHFLNQPGLSGKAGAAGDFRHRFVEGSIGFAPARINNAIKFTDEKGEVSVTAHPLEEKIEIAVRDTGVGMAPEKLERLFHIEENASTKGTQGEVGSGLGLHLCKELVEKHGGVITVESAVNKGSTFRFTLPAVGSPFPR